MRSSRKNRETRSVCDVHTSQKGEVRNIWNKLFGKGTLNLHPKFRARHPWITTGAIIGAIVLLGLGVRGVFVRAEVMELYPSSCLGTWQSPERAQGNPESLSASTTIEAGTAASFNGESSEIFCRTFVPPETTTKAQIIHSDPT